MLYPEPFTIDNFLSPAELEHFDKVLADPEKYGYFWDNNSLIMTGDKIIQDIKLRINELFNINNGYLDMGDMIQKMSIGENLVYHYDQYSRAGDIESAKYGIVMYLNDNFTGGELDYKLKDIQLKPVRGMFAAHPSTEEYTHGVLEVLSGTRYSISAFVHSFI